MSTSLRNALKEKRDCDFNANHQESYSTSSKIQCLHWQMQTAIEFQVHWQCKFVSKWDQSFWRSHAPQYYRIYGMSTIGWAPCKIPLLSLKCWCGPILGSKLWYQPHQEWLTLLLHCLRKLQACQSVNVKVWKWNLFAWYCQMSLLTLKANWPEEILIPHELIKAQTFWTAWLLKILSAVIGHVPPLANVAAMTAFDSQFISKLLNWN